MEENYIFTDKELNSFYKLLFKKIRLQKKMTQKQVAELLGKKTITIQAYENDRLNLNFNTLYLLVNRLNLYKEFILKMIDDDFVNEFNKENISDFSMIDFVLNDKIETIINNLFQKNTIEKKEIIDIIVEKGEKNLKTTQIFKRKKTLERELKAQILKALQETVFLNSTREKCLQGNLLLDLTDEIFDFVEFLLYKHKL